MGGGGTTQQTQSSQSTTLPPDYALPAAISGTHQANVLGNLPYSQYPYVPVDPTRNNKNSTYRNIITGEIIPRAQLGSQPFQSAIAPLNQQQMTSVGNIANWANNPSNVLDIATGQLTDTMGGSYLNPQSNPYLSAYVQQAQGDVTRNYMNTVMPQLAAAATRAGAFGGSGDTLMRTEAMRNLGDTLSKTATDIYYPNYSDERNRQMQAQLFAPQLDQAYMPHYQAGLAAGDIERQAQQDYLNEIVQRQQQQVQWPYQAGAAGAGMYSPYVAGTGQTSGTSTASMSQPGASPFSQIMGGAMTAAGIAAPLLFSDIRTKENIKALDIIAELNPITFDYKPEYGKPGQIGFIADEIEKVAPGMVVTGEDGLKRIKVAGLVTLLLKAVQDQQKQINALVGERDGTL